MPRRPRQLVGNVVYHVFNRRVDKRCLFDSDDSYRVFLDLLKVAKGRELVRVHAYCLMTTHWHLAVSAEEPQHLRSYLASLSTRHAMHVRVESATVGVGHVYQGRFVSVATEGVVSYVRTVRYIEANPVVAGMVPRAEDWTWSSLHERVSGSQCLVDPGPYELPADWVELVNRPDARIEELGELLGRTASFRPAPLDFQ